MDCGFGIWDLKHRHWFLLPHSDCSRAAKGFICLSDVTKLPEYMGFLKIGDSLIGSPCC